MNGYETDLVTRDGLAVYDLDPLAGELWAVAGPAGWEVREIDVDCLPNGFRWVEEEEWQALCEDRNRRLLTAREGEQC